jgi:hypothetical protein
LQLNVGNSPDAYFAIHRLSDVPGPAVDISRGIVDTPEGIEPRTKPPETAPMPIWVSPASSDPARRPGSDLRNLIEPKLDRSSSKPEGGWASH